MKIAKFLSQHRNDYTAMMVCEHCEATEKDSYGYNDHNYHANVIPAMHCRSCGKNRAGDLRAIAAATSGAAA